MLLTTGMQDARGISESQMHSIIALAREQVFVEIHGQNPYSTALICEFYDESESARAYARAMKQANYPMLGLICPNGMTYFPPN